MVLCVRRRVGWFMSLMTMANLATLLGDSRSTYPSFPQHSAECKRPESTLQCRSGDIHMTKSRIRRGEPRLCQGTLRCSLRGGSCDHQDESNRFRQSAPADIRSMGNFHKNVGKGKVRTLHCCTCPASLRVAYTAQVTTQSTRSHLFARGSKTRPHPAANKIRSVKVHNKKPASSFRRTPAGKTPRHTPSKMLRVKYHRSEKKTTPDQLDV
jgi:hypothetical protein